MKKILAAFDGLKYSESTRDYALEMARNNESHLVGLFLEDMAYHSYKIYDLITDEGVVYEAEREKLDKKDEKIRAVAVANFTKACRKAGVHFSIHKDKNVAIQELLKESIYAELVIIDNQETLTHHPENLPTRFIHDLLPDVECPVMVVPHKYREIDRLVLLFDGEPSSVYAIKMLSYTLPVLKKHPIEIVTVNSFKQDLHIPDGRLMKEFIKRHFPSATFVTLKGLPETEIVDYLKESHGNPLVALGAYRRGKVSRWFRTSLADVIMKELNLPLFIAHH